MYPWISRTLDFGLQFCEKKCGLYMDVYGNSLHLFETHCAFLPFSSPNLDFLQAVKVKKSGHHLFHDRASKGNGFIPGLTS